MLSGYAYPSAGATETINIDLSFSMTFPEHSEYRQITNCLTKYRYMVLTLFSFISTSRKAAKALKRYVDLLVLPH